MWMKLNKLLKSSFRALEYESCILIRLNVPRNLVYDVMADINPEGLEPRGSVGQPKRPKRNQVFLPFVLDTIFVFHPRERLNGIQYVVVK